MTEHKGPSCLKWVHSVRGERCPCFFTDFVLCESVKDLLYIMCSVWMTVSLMQHKAWLLNNNNSILLKCILTLRLTLQGNLFRHLCLPFIALRFPSTSVVFQGHAAPCKYVTSWCLCFFTAVKSYYKYEYAKLCVTFEGHMGKAGLNFGSLKETLHWVVVIVYSLLW